MIKRMLSISIILILLTIFSAVPANALQTPSRLPTDSLADVIDQYVADYIGKTSPGVAVVVFSHDQIIFSKGYGYADLEAKTPVVPDQTVFEYGSVSKIFVYTTIMQLVEQGLLDLTTDIRQYLPNDFLRHLRFEQPITLIDIMNHQAGFEDILTDIVITHPVHKTAFLDILRTRQPVQVYQPGTISAYSNYSVALAAYIAQIQLDQELYVYLQESVFQPLGMTSTTIHPDFLDKPEIRDRRAKAYAYDPGADAFGEIGWSYIPLYPVGAASGTAEDLARFAMALMPEDGAGGLLFNQRETLDEMFSQTLSMGPGMTGFAHGFIEYDGPVRGVGHGGNTAGFSAQLNIVPEQRFGVLVLANAASEIRLTEGITSLLMRHADSTVEPKPTPGNLPDASLLEGRYIMARRPHHGFLKLYGFLGFLKVEFFEQDILQVSLGDQSGIYRQTQPYLFERTAASGPLFEYNFDKIYFEMKDDRVFRISGDFMPLPGGYTIPWLIMDAILVSIGCLFFILAPGILLVIGLIKHRRSKRTLDIWFGLMLASGLALVINNVILVMRMLVDNYRSFSEVQLQLILNYPFALLGIVAAIACIFKCRKTKADGVQRIFQWVTMVVLAALLYILIKWEFVQLLF